MSHQNVTVSYKDSQTYTYTLDIAETTIGQLKAEVQKSTRIPPIQQELSYKQADQKHVLLDNLMPLKILGLAELSFTLKNLGKQVSWKKVFYVEYLGPLLIMPLLYLLGDKSRYTEVQSVALLMGVLHYLKREYETAYIHVFSRESMPFKRLFINSVHYWIFFALLNSLELYLYPNGHSHSKPVLAVLLALWALSEFCNLQCHKVLGGFRNPKLAKTQQPSE